MVMLPDGGDYREAGDGYLPSEKRLTVIWEYKPGERSFSLTALRIAVEDRRENNIDECAPCSPPWGNGHDCRPLCLYGV